MAQRIAKANGIGVRFEIADERAQGYNAPVFMDMDTARIQALGWRVAASDAAQKDRLDVYAQMMCQFYKGDVKEPC